MKRNNVTQIILHPLPPPRTTSGSSHSWGFSLVQPNWVMMDSDSAMWAFARAGAEYKGVCDLPLSVGWKVAISLWGSVFLHSNMPSGGS